ncbi:P27 family phage terminase small subunit [Vannielia litorea]|nr:P27 family phage terminase small subunit [Vannielia litorea]
MRIAARDVGYAELLITTSNGNLIQNTLVGIQRRSADDMVKFGAELGMTPSAGTRLKAVPPDREPNPYDRFLKRP